MITSDFHVHTRFCDGAHTPREMVEAAIQKGMSSIGFSAHSYTEFDESYCLLKEKEEAYREEIEALKTEFSGKIRILCGIEQDRYGTDDPSGYDFVIGSVHYVKKDGIYYPIDGSPSEFGWLGDEVFYGDFYALCEAYYATVAELCEVMEPSVIGHFDLVSKFNEDGHFFDETDPRYAAAWQAAMDALLPYDIPFEVNTGAIARGFRTTPYPSDAQLEYLALQGGSVVFASDCHHKDTLCFDFERWEEKLLNLDIPIVTL